MSLLLASPMLILPSAGGGFDPTLTSRDSASLNNGSSTPKTLSALDTSAISTSDGVIVPIGVYSLAGTVNSVTLDGVAAAQIISQTNAGGSTCLAAFARFAAQSWPSTSDLVIGADAAFLSVGAELLSIPGATLMTQITSDPTTTQSVVTLTGNTTTGTALCGVAQTRDDVTGTMTWVGATESVQMDIRTNEYFSSAIANNITGDTPRTVTCTQGGTNHMAGLLVAIS